MKKIKLVLGFIAMGAATLLSNNANAQRGGGGSSVGAFELGTATVNIGIGVGRGSYGGYGYYGAGYYGYGTAFGAKVAAERGMWQLGPGVLSLGAEFGGSFGGGNGGYKSNIVIAAIRSAYHYGFGLEKVDVYAGLSVGPGFRSYNYADQTSNKYTRHDVIVAPGAFVGATYMFSPNIGVNVEAGYDITELQGGIIFKLN